jgi:hypothetical protein
VLRTGNAFFIVLLAHPNLHHVFDGPVLHNVFCFIFPQFQKSRVQRQQLTVKYRQVITAIWNTTVCHIKLTPYYQHSTQHWHRTVTAHNTTLHHSTIQYTTQHCTVPQFNTSLQCITEHNTILLHTTPRHATPRHSTLLYSTIQYITQHNTALQYITQHCTTLQYNTSQNTTMQYVIQRNTTLLYNAIYNSTIQHCKTSHNTVVHYSTSHNTMLKYTTVQYNTSVNTTQRTIEQNTALTMLRHTPHQQCKLRGGSFQLHHSPHEVPSLWVWCEVSPLLISADGRRRGTATATSGEEQDRRYQVSAEETRTNCELGAGGLWEISVVKVKLTLCLIKQHTEAFGGEGEVILAASLDGGERSHSSPVP